MLDVRPIAYKVPVAEQEFASLTPIIQIANYGTVDALVTGHIYIYRDSTGLKLYTSELVITTILANTVVDVSALSPWSPPAPADNDYFVMCDLTAVAVQPHEPPSIVNQLGPYTFDIKPVGMGPAPAAHGVTHEQSGADPVDVVDLGTTETDTALRLAPDGTGGVIWDSASSGTPPAHASTHEAAGSDRVLPLSAGVASAAAPTPPSDDCDIYYLSALAEAADFQTPSGTPVDGQKLIIRILDDGAARVLSWDAVYTERGATLPLITTASKYLYIGLIYNDTESTWDCVAVSAEA